MKSHDEILRIYQQHFGHSHEAGLFAVFAAGVEDGKHAERGLARAPAPSPTVTHPNTTSTGSAAVTAKPVAFPGKPSAR